MPRKDFLPALAAALLAGLTISHAAWAQPVPQSFVASPDVYKVVAENEQYRIIAVTWKPGSRWVRRATSFAPNSSAA